MCLSVISTRISIIVISHTFLISSTCECKSCYGCAVFAPEFFEIFPCCNSIFICLLSCIIFCSLSIYVLLSCILCILDYNLHLANDLFPNFVLSIEENTLFLFSFIQDFLCGLSLLNCLLQNLTQIVQLCSRNTGNTSFGWHILSCILCSSS